MQSDTWELDALYLAGSSQHFTKLHKKVDNEVQNVLHNKIYW